MARIQILTCDDSSVMWSSATVLTQIRTLNRPRRIRVADTPPGTDVASGITAAQSLGYRAAQRDIAPHDAIGASHV